MLHCLILSCVGGRIDSIFGVNVRAHAERERKFGPICNVFAQP